MPTIDPTPDLAAQVAALTAQVTLLAIEVERTRAMLQTLSEGHDTNRRELSFATTRANELSTTLIQKAADADAKKAEAEAIIRAAGK